MSHEFLVDALLHKKTCAGDTCLTRCQEARESSAIGSRNGISVVEDYNRCLEYAISVRVGRGRKTDLSTKLGRKARQIAANN